MDILKSTSLAALCVLLAGCVSTSWLRYSSSSYSKVSPSVVTVYQDTSDVSCKYDEIGTVRARGGAYSQFVGEEQLKENAIETAAERGANAVIYRGTGFMSTGLSRRPTVSVEAIRVPTDCE